MRSRSEETALAFYERLGAAGLAERTRAEWDAEIVSRLREELSPAARVLDLGCGYGRIAVPLARSGHPVVALDLSSGMLRAGRRESSAASLPVDWVRATMRSLPVADRSVDAVLCLWTAFFELVEPREQVETLSEVLRILRPAGWALFEGPIHAEPTPAEIASGERSGPVGRVLRFRVGDAENTLYCHDASSLRAVAQEAGIEEPSIYTAPWAGRERLFLRFARGV